MFLHNPYVFCKHIFSLVILFVSIFAKFQLTLASLWLWYTSWSLIQEQDGTNVSFISHIHVRFVSCVLSLIVLLTLPSPSSAVFCLPTVQGRTHQCCTVFLKWNSPNASDNVMLSSSSSSPKSTRGVKAYLLCNNTASKPGTWIWQSINRASSAQYLHTMCGITSYMYQHMLPLIIPPIIPPHPTKHHHITSHRTPHSTPHHHTTPHVHHTTHHTTHYMTSKHKAWHDTTQVLLNTSVYIVPHYIVLHLLHHAVCMSHWSCPLPLVVRSRPPQNHDDQQKEREQKMPKCLIQPQLRPILFTQNPKQDQKFQYPLRVLETFPCTNIHFHYAIISKLNQFFKDHLQKKEHWKGLMYETHKSVT